MSSSLLWLQTETADPISRKLHGKKKKRGEKEQSATRLLLGKKRVGRQQGRDDEIDLRSLFSLPCHCIHKEMSTGKPKQEEGGESERLLLTPLTCDNKSLCCHWHWSTVNWYQQKALYLCACCHKLSKCSLLFLLLLFTTTCLNENQLNLSTSI